MWGGRGSVVVVVVMVGVTHFAAHVRVHGWLFGQTLALWSQSDRGGRKTSVCAALV